METKGYIYGLSYKGELVYIGLHNGKDPYYFSGGIIPRRMGKDKFIKGVIEYCNQNELQSKEIYYIHKYNPRFNLTTGGERESLGTKHSKTTIEKRKKSFMKNSEHLKKLSERFKKMNKNNNPCIKHAIECINTGEQFKSIREAARYYNVDNSFLCKHLKGDYKTVAGLKFKRL